MEKGDQARAEARIREIYAERARTVNDRYASHLPESVYIRGAQLDALARLLFTEGLSPLTDARILEVGCGTGRWLVEMESLGAQRDRLAGIDLRPESIEQGRLRLSGNAQMGGADLRVGSAAQLPWPDRTFDLVMQFTVFTSVAEAELRRVIAQEMVRVLRPGGAIIWYDFAYTNPWNSNVKKVTRRELQQLFPSCDVTTKRVTLAPPLGRRLARVSGTLTCLLESLRVMNTHYLGLLRVRPDAQ